MAAQRLVGDGIFIIGSVQFAGNLQLHGGFGRQDGLRVAPVRIRGGGHLQIGRRQSRVGHHIDADLVRRFPHACHRGKLAENNIRLHIAAVHRDAPQFHAGAAGAVLGAVPDEVVVIGIRGKGSIRDFDGPAELMTSTVTSQLPSRSSIAVAEGMVTGWWMATVSGIEPFTVISGAKLVPRVVSPIHMGADTICSRPPG